MVMSERVKKYLELSSKWDAMVEPNIDEETALLNQMDMIWWSLTKEEIAQVNAMGKT
jgi:hypothetical protein